MKNVPMTAEATSDPDDDLGWDPSSYLALPKESNEVIKRRARSLPDISVVDFSSPDHQSNDKAAELEPEEKEVQDENQEEDLRNIHAYLEEQRVMLEARVGLDKLLLVYNLIANVEERSEDRLDYSTIAAILGEENRGLIDEIIQLVVADNFF